MTWDEQRIAKMKANIAKIRTRIRRIPSSRRRLLMQIDEERINGYYDCVKYNDWQNFLKAFDCLLHASGDMEPEASMAVDYIQRAIHEVEPYIKSHFKEKKCKTN